MSPENVTARPEVDIAMASASSRAAAARELLAEAARHEQRVVDRDAESDERDDVLRVDRDAGDLREQEHAGDAAHDREQSGAERDQRRDDRAEHEEQEDQRERQRDDLRALEIGEEHLVEAVVDREDAGRLHAELVGRDLRAELFVVVARDVDRVLDGDVDGDGVSVVRDLARRIDDRRRHTAS